MEFRRVLFRSGFETFIPVDGDPKAVAHSTAIVTRHGCERIARYAFEYAVRHGREKVTICHKANILKAASGLFLEVGHDVAEEYAGRIEVRDVIVDAGRFPVDRLTGSEYGP